MAFKNTGCITCIAFSSPIAMQPPKCSPLSLLTAPSRARITRVDGAHHEEVGEHLAFTASSYGSNRPEPRGRCPKAPCMLCILLRRYANEARIMWNAPLPHHADAFHTDSLDHHFDGAHKWHLWSTDQSNRPLVSLTSKVVDRLLKEKSKMSFIASKYCKDTKSCQKEDANAGVKRGDIHTSLSSSHCYYHHKSSPVHYPLISV